MQQIFFWREEHRHQIGKPKITLYRGSVQWALFSYLAVSIVACIFLFILIVAVMLNASESGIVQKINASLPLIICWGGFSSFILLLGMVGLWNTLGRVERYKKLEENGVILDGTITKVDMTQVDGDDILSLTYGFSDPQTGQFIEGNILETRNDLKHKLPQHGTPVKIIYRDSRTFEIL